MARSESARRRTFDDAADLYDRVRPTYPPQLFDDLADLADLRSESRVLEIGCGTGQATIALAERGYEIVAVELGANMGALARRHLARFPRVHVVVSAFEEWPLPVERFDAVVSATAFHWLDPAVRVIKSADALRPGGTLATIHIHHITGGDQNFWVEVQRCYERWDPKTPPLLGLLSAADVAPDAAELDQSGRFGPITFRRYEWNVSYSTGSYLDLLRTYSDHRALEPRARDGLLVCIGDLIDSRYEGCVTKGYLAELWLAQCVEP